MSLPGEYKCPHLDHGFCPDCVRRIGESLRLLTFAASLPEISQLLKQKIHESIVDQGMVWVRAKLLEIWDTLGELSMGWKEEEDAKQNV